MAGGNLIVQVAPMEHVARVVLQEQESGAMRQQALQQVTPEKLQRDNEQVAKTSNSEAGQKVRRGKERHGRPDQHGQQTGGGRGAEDQQEMTPEELEALQLEPTGNVWAGNIVNMKV